MLQSFISVEKNLGVRCTLIASDVDSFPQADGDDMVAMVTKQTSYKQAHIGSKSRRASHDTNDKREEKYYRETISF